MVGCLFHVAVYKRNITSQLARYLSPEQCYLKVVLFARAPEMPTYQGIWGRFSSDRATTMASVKPGRQANLGTFRV